VIDVTNPYDKKDPDSDDKSKELKPDGEKDSSQKLSLDDFVTREAKAFLPLGQKQPGEQKLPGSDANTGSMTKGYTTELGRLLSGQPAAKLLQDVPPKEFKFTMPKGVQSQQGNFAPGGRPFLQLKKSEFTPKVEEQTLDLRDDAVDKFLIETDLDHSKKKLTDGELRELERSRRAIADAMTPEDVASNALHLAKLYQHLRYIEEAKKAVQLSLGIDPDHMQGKQLFTELERLHPIDIGVAPYSVSQQLTKSNLRKRIRELSGGKVVVVGDLLIDELLEGKPERISREAPVLILEHVDTVLIPGGAANTAHNIAALGGECHAVGVCGTDEYAGKLARLLADCGIHHSLVPDASRPTTVKTRILSKSHSLMQQLLRLDRISHEPLSPDIEAKLALKVEEAAALSGYKAIVLSDYRAGVITDGVIEICRKASRAHNLLVIVDAQGQFERFKDVTIMTPNQPDAEKAVGFELADMDSLSRAARHIFIATNAKALLITRGAAGMALFEQGHEPVELPVFNRSDVFDVTGAGDTVVATLALALVSGASFVEAMALGNLAAGIVVRKIGTAVTSQSEMLENLERLSLPE